MENGENENKTNIKNTEWLKTKTIKCKTKTKTDELCAALTNCTATYFGLVGYSLLAKVALDLISSPASQAYTERLFRVCGYLMAEIHRSLERLKVNMKYVDV